MWLCCCKNFFSSPFRILNKDKFGPCLDKAERSHLKIAEFFSPLRIATVRDLSDELERSKPGSSTIVNLAKRLGMSYTQTLAIRTRSLDDLGVEDMQT